MYVLLPPSTDLEQVRERVIEREREIDGLREGGLIQKECDEVDVWKRKCRELEARLLRLEGENSILRGINGERLSIASVGKPVLGLVIDISDSEDEKIAKDQGAEEHPKKVGFDFKAEATAQKSSMMMHFNQTSINAVEDDGEGDDENFLSTPAAKRKRAARVFNSDSESEVDGDDDIPISQLKMGIGGMDGGNVGYGSGMMEVGGMDGGSVGYGSVRLLPLVASCTLFVEGLPVDCTHREVSHIFRPFAGFQEIRLVNRESRYPGIMVFRHLIS